jgi:hypothetical protein
LDPHSSFLFRRLLLSGNVRAGIKSSRRLPSVDLDKPISDLLTEAGSDLVRKHGRTEKRYSTVAPESKRGKK